MALAGIGSAAALVAALLLGGTGCGGGGLSSPRTGVVIVNTDQGSGSGIVLSRSGLVLTNDHVIRGTRTIQIEIPSGLTFSARVLGHSVSKDIALLQVRNPRGLDPARIGNSSTVRVGRSVTVVGNAGGTDSLTVMTGRVTGLRRAITVADDAGERSSLTGLIETNAPILAGDSGGPLLAGGRVIGVSVASSALSGYGENDGYAIPVNTAISIARQIEAGRRSSTVHVVGMPRAEIHTGS